MRAVQFIDCHQAQLLGKPVWLFSSGPLGAKDPKPSGDPAHIRELIEHTGARGHRVFVGKLDRRHLSLGERLVTNMVKAPEGDFRDWTKIRAWAREIASALPAPVAAGP
jgi:menaquinone-dependent protoporphyrinogen oxidase